MRLYCYLLLLFFGPFAVHAQRDGQIASVALWKTTYDSAQYYWHTDAQKSVTLLRAAEQIAFNDLGIYDENYLAILNDLGLAYSQIKDFGRAEEYLNKNLIILHELYAEENAQTLLSACNLATVILKSGNDLKAHQLYKDILAKSRKVDATVAYMSAAYGLINLYEVHEQYDSAALIIRDALSVHLENPSIENEYKLRLAEGRMLRKLKQYSESSKAFSVLTKSLHASSVPVQDLLYAIQMEQSLIHLETGLYAQAEKELLDLYRTLRNQNETDEGLLTELTNSLAYTYEKLAVYDKALYYYQESLTRCLKTYGYNSLGCAIMQNNIAGIYQKQGLTAQAISQYEEFIQTFKNLSRQNTSVYFTALNNLATAYRQAGQLDKALAYYTEIYTSLTALKQGETDLAATVMNNIGVTNMFLGKYDEAIPYFKNVIRIKEGFYGTESPVLQDALENLAVTLWASGEPEAALPLFRRSLALTEHEIRYIFPHLTETEQVQFYKRQKQNFERFNTLVIQQQLEIPELKIQLFNNQLLLKSILFFTNKKRDARVRGNSKLTALVERANSASVQLGHFYQLPAEELKALHVSIPRLEQEIDSLEKVIRHALADEAIPDQHYTWKDIRNSLKANEALVDIIRFRKYDVFHAGSELLPQQINSGFTDSIYYAALITTSETTEYPKLVLLKNGKLLETRYHKYYINTLQFDMEDTISYAQFWLPIEREVSGKQKIYITADGVYHQLNLNVIRDRENKFIIEKFDLQGLLNPAQLVNRTESTPINFSGSVLIGDPVFGSTLSKENFEPLPGSNEEIKGIVHALKLSPAQATLYLRQAATEINLKKVHSPAILHIATHGFFSADMVELNDQAKNDFMFHSGIILSSGSSVTTRDFDSDGIVTAYEVMNLDLAKTELVILSACETGLGKVENSEGVYGLQRSFLQAGASNVMISLWKVEDVMTKDLMVKFYTYLGQHKNRYEAFKLAQLDLLHTVKNPRQWGGFVMMSGN